MATLAMSFAGIENSLFGCAIGHVIFLRAHAEMFWIAALWIVASMKDYTFLIQPYAHPEISGQTVRSVALAIDAEHSISISVMSLLPFPAAGLRINTDAIRQAVFHNG